MEEDNNSLILKNKLHKFIVQKSISQNFLNVAVLQNQISILVSTLKKDTYDGTDKALTSFIILNIFLQSLIFCCISVIDYIKPDHSYSKPLNLVVTLISGLIMIINITITILISPVVEPESQTS